MDVTDTPPSTLLRLPDELLLSIVEYVHVCGCGVGMKGCKHDLLSIRMACKRLTDVAAKAAFQHVTFVQDAEGFARLRRLSESHHRSAVLHLTYKFEDFGDDDLSEEEFSSSFRDSARCCAYACSNVGQIYRDYCRGRQYQAYLHSRNLDITLFTAAVSQFPNLRSIHISQSFTKRSGPWCEELDPPYGFLKFLELPTSRRLFDTITTSLSAAAITIRALTLRSDCEAGPCALTGIIQGLSLTKKPQYLKVFGQLTALNIFLPVIASGGEVNFGGLSAFISSLPMLQQLVFSGSHAFPTKFLPVFLSSLRVPRLEAVDISNGAFKCPKSLSTFFSHHSESLQRVGLADVVLDGGSWEEVFLKMREALRLRSSAIRGNFYSGDKLCLRSADIGQRSSHIDYPLLPSRAIEDFVERRSDVEPFCLLRHARRLAPGPGVNI